MNAVINQPLNSSERSRWRLLWNRVRDGHNEFWEYVAAVAEIRNQRLYRDNFNSFDEFLDSEVGFGRNYANKLIEACEVRQKVGTIVPRLEIVDTLNTEAQLRVIKTVKDGDLPDFLARVQAMSNGKPVTAALLKEAKAKPKPTQSEGVSEPTDSVSDTPGEVYEDVEDGPNVSDDSPPFEPDPPKKDDPLKDKKLARSVLIKTLQAAVRANDAYHDLCRSPKRHKEIVKLLQGAEALVWQVK